MNSAEDIVPFAYHDACTVGRKSNGITPWCATLAHDGIHTVEYGLAVGYVTEGHV